VSAVSGQPLRAPWRADYVQSQSGDRVCPFCEALKQSSVESLLVFEGESAFALLNAYPYAPGHVLICPRRHVDSLQALTTEESHELIELTRRMLDALDMVLGPAGFNVGVNQGRAAGAGVPGHVHQHVVPRWDGDTDFMDVLADTPVLSVPVLRTRDQLRRSLAGS